MRAIAILLLLILAGCSADHQDALRTMAPAEEAYPWNTCMANTIKAEAWKARAYNVAVVPEDLTTTAETECAELWPGYLAELRKATAGSFWFDVKGHSDAEIKAKSHQVYVRAATELLR